MSGSKAKNLALLGANVDATGEVDSNTIDGIDSAQFLRSDQSDTMSGELSIEVANGEALKLINTDASISGGESLTFSMEYPNALASSTGWKHISRYSGGAYQVARNVDNAGYVEALTILESGNVGIGTTSPEAPLQIGDATNQFEFATISSMPGYYSGIKLARGNGDWSAIGHNNYMMLVTDNGWEVAKTTSKGNNATGRATYLKVDDDEVNVEKQFGFAQMSSDPTGTRAGQAYWNTTDSQLKIYDGSGWTSVGLVLDGSSPAAAAESALAIKQLTGTTQDGLYWIQVPNVGVMQVYCDMNTDGGGWMHCGTFSDNNENASQVSSTAQQSGGVHPWGAPAFPSQDLGLWEDTTTLGSQSFTSDFKSAVWAQMPMTQMLMKDSGGSLRNLFYTNSGQISSQTLSSWFGSLSWNANGSETSSSAYSAGRVTGLNITNFGVNDPALESGNKSVMLFKFGERDGVQDGNKDRSVIARHYWNGSNNVDGPAGIGCFRSADPTQSGWYQRWRDIVPNSSGFPDEPPTNISGAPYNYTMWVR